MDIAADFERFVGHPADPMQVKIASNILENAKAGSKTRIHIMQPRGRYRSNIMRFVEYAIREKLYD